MLTPAQKQELEREVDRRVGRAKVALSSLTGKNLSNEDAALVNQIQTFIKQNRRVEVRLFAPELGS